MDLNPEVTFPICIAVFMAGLAVLKYISHNRKGNPMSNGKLTERVISMEVQCEERTKGINDDLDRGEKKFETIMGLLDKHGKSLVRIDERVKSIQIKNGIPTND